MSEVRTSVSSYVTTALVAWTFMCHTKHTQNMFSEYKILNGRDKFHGNTAKHIPVSNDI